MQWQSTNANGRLFNTYRVPPQTHPPVNSVAMRGVGAVCGWFGLTLNAAATFDVFYRLQVTNYGLFYILFDSAPGGSDCIDLREWCLHAQTAHQLFRATFLATNSCGCKLKAVCVHDRSKKGDHHSFLAFLSDHMPLFRVSSNSKCVFVPSGFSVSHFSPR
jgi:hypothetical protein